MAKIPRRGKRMTKLELGTKVVLKELIQKTGHVLAVEDSDVIIKLNDLVAAVSNPVDVDEWAILEQPIQCGNISLRAPSPAILLWLKDFVCPWFEEEDEILELAVPFALAHDYESLCKIKTANQARRKIIAWCKRIKCSQARLVKAIKALLPSNGNNDKADVGFGPVIAFLCREYGENPTYWLCEASMGMIHTMIGDHNAKVMAEYKAAVRASAGSKGKPPTMPSLKLRAIKELMDYQKELSELWQM